MPETRRTIDRMMAMTLVAAGLGACSKSTLPPPPKPALTRIQVLPVLPPANVRTRNSSLLYSSFGALGALANYASDQANSEEFQAKIEAERQQMGAKLTTALVKQLRREGYQAEVLQGVVRNPESPEEVDYKGLPGKEPVLHVYYLQADMHSSTLSTYYVPRINITASLVGRGSEDALWAESIYYGADSKGNASWSIPSPDRFQFADFQSLIKQSPQVLASYDHGIEALARRVARNLRKQY
jgi:hypothetical protein